MRKFAPREERKAGTISVLEVPLQIYIAAAAQYSVAQLIALNHFAIRLSGLFERTCRGS